MNVLEIEFCGGVLHLNGRPAAEWVAEVYRLRAATASPLTEQQIAQCLIDASCIGTVRMSCESGPYGIDRPSNNAVRLVRAVEQTLGIKA